MENGNDTAATGRTITFGDFFSGIGAMRLGFEQACMDAGLTPECVGFSEIDLHATGTYLRHFPGTPVLGDIVALAASGNIPKCDVVLAGFPCQDASSAGKRLGLGGERGKLFFTLAEIIGVVRPSAFLLENVKGLASLDGGKALKTILATLRGLGYDVDQAVLNSRNFGVPQNRPRIYIVGFLGNVADFAFPLPTDSSKSLKEILEESSVDGRYYVTERSLERIRKHKARHEARGNGFGARFLNAEHDVAGTIKSSNWGREDNFVVDHRLESSPIPAVGKSPRNREHVRRLTPLEWERLQGLPDRFTEGQADGHRYRQLGNAVTVPVIGAISGKTAVQFGSLEVSPPAHGSRTLRGMRRIEYGPSSYRKNQGQGCLRDQSRRRRILPAQQPRFRPCGEQFRDGRDEARDSRRSWWSAMRPLGRRPSLPKFFAFRKTKGR